MTWRVTLVTVGRWLLALVLLVVDVVLCVFIGEVIDDFLTAQLGAFESDATAWTVIGTLVLCLWGNRKTRRTS